MIITGIAYIPGYLISFMVGSLLMDRQPEFKVEYPKQPVTVLIAAWNEEKNIGDTLRQLSKQDYEGDIQIILIDNNCTDSTVDVADQVAKELGLFLQVVTEKKAGKNYALNTALSYVETELMITLDADTLLHTSAIRFIVCRMMSAPEDVCAVAGAVLVRNSRQNIWTKIQEWDYFLAIASVKRLQGMYQQTLVAQGAFSLYRTKVIQEIGGWDDVIGEDIVLTWKFLKKGFRVFFEPLSVAFTSVPASFKSFSIQRSRWARGMIEGLKAVKPWQQPRMYGKYLTGVNLILPYVDAAYTFFWLPGLVLALFGIYWIAGPLTLLVLPITILSYMILYRYQKSVFRALDLKVRRNNTGFILFIIIYQIIMSPVSIYGYLQELLKLKRIWR
ncbi:glycosyltransferase family 2 protein [Paenibacillus lupini]|uniref:glycosyltransferase family 2 protein n=1 Tax=Paenibacillus lupini TaxID=1450204 RepID=UPI001FB8FB52|nr:glycosyltransferase family 2 protein [Paenibacillus lupini]NIK24127.1 biofilm PGA synthesis N-glycosyltransferase PgaC [Paenibacillus lupini]